MLIISLFVHIETNKGAKMAVCLLYMYKYHGYDFTPPVSMLCILLTFVSSSSLDKYISFPSIISGFHSNIDLYEVHLCPSFYF